jgi:hypothetical protein
MAETFLTWIADRFTNTDIIDLYFILSDLVDIPISETVLFESAHYDSLATHTTERFQPGDLGNIPLGKLVL